MSKIKKILTEDYRQAKYFSDAVESSIEEIWRIYDEIEGQTEYQDDQRFKMLLLRVKNDIMSLNNSFDDLIRIIK